MGNKKNLLWDGIEIKLLTPLSAEFFPNEESGWEGEQGEPGSEELWDGMDLMECMDAIQEAVDRENSPEEEGGEPCNLMEYFYGSDSIKEKVKSAVVSVESAEDILYGCTTLHLKENLTSEEFHELCEYITGQYSDGWGEGFEQRNIQVDGGTLNVHFWQGNGPGKSVRNYSSSAMTEIFSPSWGMPKGCLPEMDRSRKQTRCVNGFSNREVTMRRSASSANMWKPN